MSRHRAFMALEKKGTRRKSRSPPGRRSTRHRAHRHSRTAVCRWYGDRPRRALALRRQVPSSCRYRLHLPTHDATTEVTSPSQVTRAAAIEYGPSAKVIASSIHKHGLWLNKLWLRWHSIGSPRTDWTLPRKHALVSLMAGTGRARPETQGLPRGTRGFGWWHR